jgi:hypothetical protein
MTKWLVGWLLACLIYGMAFLMIVMTTEISLMACLIA